MPSLPDRARAIQGRYSHGRDRPLGSFLVLIGAYGAVTTAGGVIVHRSRRRLPRGVDWADLALAAVATHKIARLLAKDPVTSPLRAPFTQFEGTSGEAELAESVLPGGMRKAVGELVTCPFCLGQWVATALMFGLALAPRVTRWTCSMFTTLTLADFLQLGYAAAQQAQQRLGEQ